NVVDMIAGPQRLEDAVGEAQHQDVLDRFLAEEMIDPIDLVFGQHLEDLRVEGLGRCKVMPEGLFDDHPPPSVLRLSREPGAAARAPACALAGQKRGSPPAKKNSRLPVLFGRPGEWSSGFSGGGWFWGCMKSPRL